MKLQVRQLTLRYLAILVSVFLLNIPTLTRGSAPVDACGIMVRLPLRLSRFQNCDAPGFVTVAQDPGILLASTGSQMVTRPVIGILAFVVNTLIETVTFHHVDITNAPNTSALPELGFIFLNFLIIAFTILLALNFVGITRRQWPLGVLMLLLLAANPVTRAFLWTAHLQVFNIAMPVVTAVLAYWILRQPLQVPPRVTASLGLLLGLATLTYGNFAVTIATLGACFLVKRCARSAILLVTSSVLVVGIWAAAALRITGSFTSVEVRDFDQFVWVFKLPTSGNPLQEIFGKLGAWMLTFTDAQTVFATLILILLVVLSTYFMSADRQAQIQTMNNAGPIKDKLAAILLTLSFSLIFYIAMGFYQTRLSWMLVVGLVLAISTISQGLTYSLSKQNQLLFSIAALSLGSVWYAYWISIPGPWH